VDAEALWAGDSDADENEGENADGAGDGDGDTGGSCGTTASGGEAVSAKAAAGCEIEIESESEARWDRGREMVGWVLWDESQPSTLDAPVDFVGQDGGLSTPPVEELDWDQFLDMAAGATCWDEDLVAEGFEP
jgi:hypothetical protein